MQWVTAGIISVERKEISMKYFHECEFSRIFYSTIQKYKKAGCDFI